MSIEDIATINVSTTGAGVTRAGYGVPLIVSHTASWVERYRSYASTSAVSEDFAVNTPEYLAASSIFGQSPRVTRILIGRAAFVPAQRFSISVNTVATGTDYRVRIGTPTGVVFTDQQAAFNSNGATAWVASNLYSRGDIIIQPLVATTMCQLFSCLGPSGANMDAGFTGYGGSSGPSGTAAAILDNQLVWMFVGTGSTGSITNDAIMQGLKARIEYMGAPTCVGTGTNQLTASLQGSVGSRTLRLLANTSGKFFGLQLFNRNVLAGSQDHSDPGIATDLAAIKVATNDWYGLVTLFNSSSFISATAAWVETNFKLYPAASIDTAVARTAESGSATDIGHTLKAAAYARSWVFFHSHNDEFADAAQLGRFFPKDPGTETWRMKTLSGVTADAFTSTEKTNLDAKYAHYYYTLGGVNVIGGDGLTAANEYVDVTRGLDWYRSELQADIADLVIQSDKVPYTNPGIDMIAAKVERMNRRGIARGLIAADPAPVITVPDVADVSTADKTARELNDVETEWTLAGAIHHITVTVTANA